MVVYEDKIFVSENLYIKIKAYLFTYAIFHKLNKLEPNGAIV